MPLNISEWRSSHVQAWLAFRVELPQYLPFFKEGSVDGLVLLKHVDDKLLESCLGVSSVLHRKKIVEGIAALREQQKEYNEKLNNQVKKKATLESDNKEKIKPKQAEKPKTKSSKTKTKKNKSTTSTVPKTVFADVREQNEISRVKIERDIKAYRKTTHLDDEEKQEQDWPFGYSLNNMKSNKSGAYENVMVNILNSNDLKVSKDHFSEPVECKNKTLPTTRTCEEIIDILKHAMLKVSRRLIEFEKLKEKKTNLDEDIETVEKNTINLIMQARNEVATSNHKFVNEDQIIVSNIENDDNYEDDENDSILSGSVPSYNAALNAEPYEGHYSDQSDNYNSSDEDDLMSETEPPPSYRNLSSPLPQIATSNNLSRIQTKFIDEKKSELYDNCEVIFNAFLELSNEAAWLSKVQRLTRLKFMGGIESILKIKMSWGQFGGVW